jgi:DNA-binding MarR family transcriptional regulator
MIKPPRAFQVHRCNENQVPFYPLFLGFQRRLVAAHRSLGTALSPNEIDILSALVAQPGLQAQELVNRLQIGKSTISRNLLSLLVRSLVRERRAPTDRRVKTLWCTPLGQTALERVTPVETRALELALEPLEPSSHRRLTELLARIVDALDSSPANSPRLKHPLTQTARRLARGFGFNGASCMGTTLSAGVCQILHLVSTAEDHLDMKRLVQLMANDTTTTSRTVSRLTANGLLRKTRPARDQRLIGVSLTPRGRTQAQENASTAEEFLRKTINVLSDEERGQLAALLQKFALAPFITAGSVARRVVVRRILGDAARQEARRFLIELLCTTGTYDNLPERLIAADSLTLVATTTDTFRGGKQNVGILEIQVTRDTGTTVQLLWDDYHGGEVPTALLAAALTQTRLKAIRLDTVRPTHPLRRLYPALRSRTPLVITQGDLAWLTLALTGS